MELKIKVKELNDLNGVTFALSIIEAKDSDMNVVGVIRPQINGTLLFTIQDRNFLVDGREIFAKIVKKIKEGSAGWDMQHRNP